MKLVESNSRKPKNIPKYPTVGDMLKYIKDNKIPMDAEVVVEHVNDFYLWRNHWNYYDCGNRNSFDGPEIMLPIHNGFGSIEGKKYFALWMHY